MIQKDELLRLTNNGEDILLNIFNLMGLEFKGYGQPHLNPFYSDTKPAMIFTKKENTLLFKDFGNTDYSGDIFSFAAFYYGRRLDTEFNLLISDIANDLNISSDDFNKITQRPIKRQTANKQQREIIQIQKFDGYLISYKPAPDYYSIPFADGHISENVSFDRLVELLTKPTQFVFCLLKDGYRKKENFIKANVIALDFDEIYLHELDLLMELLYHNPNCFLAYETKRSGTEFDSDGSPIIRLRALFHSNIIFDNADKYQRYLTSIFNQYKAFNPDKQAFNPTHSFHSGGKSIFNMLNGQNIRLWRYWTYE